MSSAILYLAIVAIWACVLIPRWLRRDSAQGAGNASVSVAGSASVSAHAAGSDGFDGFDGFAGFAGPAGPDEVVPAAGFDDVDAESETVVLPVLDADSQSAHSPPVPRMPRMPRVPDPPLDGEESRRRMLTARRRLLGMLAILEAAAITLAVIGLAALWVVVPPTLMLAGYLLLLREAAHADAERAQREAEAAAAAASAAAAARNRARARARREADTRTEQHPTPVEGVPLAARFAAAPVPADYEDSGRDFAPGLAGKYTPSTAATELGDDDQYGYEAPPLRRAVGD